MLSYLLFTETKPHLNTFQLKIVLNGNYESFLH